LKPENGGSRKDRYVAFGGKVGADLDIVDMQYLVEFSATEEVHVEAISEIAGLFRATTQH
jgi:hypothetical protein